MEETKETNKNKGINHSISCFLGSLLLLASVLLLLKHNEAGMVLYPVAFVFTFITGLIAFIRGIRSRLLMGLAIIFTFVSLIYYYPFGIRFQQNAQCSASRSSLNSIGKALELYEAKYNLYPDTLQRLVDTNLVNSNLLCCPAPHKDDPLKGRYFYFAPAAQAGTNTSIVVMDHTRYGEAYLLLLRNGCVQTYWFKTLLLELEKPENREFAKAWREYIPEIR